MASAASYIDGLQADGRFVFTTADAVAALGTGVTATRAALRRLKQAGLIATPHRGFHVVVPPAHRRLGCLPADQFLPELMAHLGEPYHVGLLSAAGYHGAAHQAPMRLQVVVSKPRRPIACGGVHVDFIANRGVGETPVVERNTETGVIRIATPEATAVEVVGHPERCGYLDNVATVLAELAEVMTEEALATEARRAPTAWVQRLGYLLDLVGETDLARRLQEVIEDRNCYVVALAPWAPMKGASRDDRWRLALNATVEPDA